jgi:ubiquinone/menaquinone biosynthesis C-methylase UbiE
MHQHKFNPEKAARLIAPERYHHLKPDILLQKLAVPPGSTILDIGCGNGFFTFPAAAAMGEHGMVIAADMSELMLAALRDRNPPDTVQVLLTEEVAMDVEDDEVDAVVAITLYHEFAEAAANLAELKRVLKPGGKLLVLDWIPDDDPEHGPKHRISRAAAVEEIKAGGFAIELEEDYTEEHWLIIASH